MPTSLEVFQNVLALSSEGLPIDKLRQWMAEDCVIHQTPAAPFGGEWYGPQGFIDMMAAVARTFQDFGFNLEAAITDGDEHVALSARIYGDYQGEQFSTRLLEFWTIRNNKVQEITVAMQMSF